jgi:glycosyltransferase involved in cell wall biosynthesis
VKAGRALRVAVIGPIAFPAVAGGLSRHCEELYGRLTKHGIDATVYVRKPYMTPDVRTYEGMTLVALPVPSRRGVETFVYGAIASLRALFGRFDVVHYHGVAAGTFCFLQRLRPGRRLLFTHHRADWMDDKWGTGPKTLLRWTAWIALFVSHAVIAVSRSLADGLRAMRDRPITVIPNGIELPPVGSPDAVRAFGLEPRRYALCVGRIVPEKGLDTLVDAFALLAAGGEASDLQLAVVGAPRYSEAYAEDLERRAGPNVRFLGRQSGETLGSLYANAAVFVTGSSNEGYPIGVLEALGFGSPIVASDIPPHREVLDGTGNTYFPLRDAAALAAAIAAALGTPPDATRPAPVDRDEHSWDVVAERTLDVLRALGDG